MVTVKISGLRLHGRHGVMDQERVVGNEFSVDIVMKCRPEAEIAAAADDISLTVNYAEVIDVVRREMAVPSRLIENVAWRIAKAICSDFPVVEEVTVEVTKLMPPCGVQLSGVKAEIVLNAAQVRGND